MHAVILDDLTCLSFEGEEALKDALVVVYTIADRGCISSITRGAVSAIKNNASV